MVVKNYGPFLGTLNIRCRIIVGTQKGTIILTTTYVASEFVAAKVTGQKRDVMKRHLPAPLSPQNCAPHSINKSLYCRGLNNYLYYFEGLLIKII